MQKSRNTIQKAKVKDSRLEVIYEEHFPEDNYSNIIDKKCAQTIHADFRAALDKLKPHLVCFCEMPEARKIIDTGIYDFDPKLLSNYVITGYTHGGSEESAGITIIGQKLLKSGKVLNLVTPFIQFSDEDAYKFAGELSAEIEACDYEATEYLFSKKWGIKQLSLGFDTPDGVDISIETPAPQKPKKRRRKKITEKEVLEEAI